MVPPTVTAIGARAVGLRADRGRAHAYVRRAARARKHDSPDARDYQQEPDQAESRETQTCCTAGPVASCFFAHDLPDLNTEFGERLSAALSAPGFRPSQKRH